MRELLLKTILCFLVTAMLLPLKGISKRSVSVDDLKSQLSQQKNPEEKIKLLLKIGVTFGEKYADSCLHYYHTALDFSQTKKLANTESEILSRIGMFHHRRGEFDKAKVYFRKNIQLVRENKNVSTQGRADSYMNMANYFKRTGVLDSAFFYYTKVEEAYKDFNDPFKFWRPYCFIGQLYSDSENYDKAGEYFEKAYALVKVSDKRLPLGYVLFHLGKHYFMTGQFEKYSPIAERWIEFKKTSKFLDTNPEHRAIILFSESVPERKKRLKEVIAHELNRNNFYMSGLHSLDLGHTFEEEGRYDEALEAYQFGVNSMKNSSSLFQLGSGYNAIYELSKKTGKYNDALVYLEKYKNLQDSIQHEKVLKNLSELEVQAETEKKDLEISQKTMQRNILFGSSAVLGILALVIFFLLRNRLSVNKTLAKQESEIQEQKIRQLEQEQKLITFNAMIEGQESERKRIAKDLHDSIGGLLSTIKSYTTAVGESHPELLNQENFIKTNKLIDEACDETRRISHNMMPRALDLSGLLPAIEDLAENVRRSGYNCDLEIIGMENELDKQNSTMIFRILQELVHNISKHAQAKNILIQLLQNENTIDLLVEDDGVGFQSSTATSDGMGLSNIKSRVEFLQGKMDIDSVKNEGTTVNISIPI